MSKQKSIHLSVLPHMPQNEPDRTDFITQMRNGIAERAAEDSLVRPGLSLEWVAFPFPPLRDSEASRAACKSNMLLGVDTETAYRMILCAEDVAQKWYAEASGNPFLILDIAYEVSRLLSVSFDCTYAVLLTANGIS